MKKIILVCIACFTFATPALAAQCGGDFDAFLDTFRREAAAQGIPASALATLDGLTPNPQVISLDRRQGVFRQSFEQFATHRIAERLAKAQRMMQTHAATLRRIEQQFGVPGSAQRTASSARRMPLTTTSIGGRAISHSRSRQVVGKVTEPLWPEP